MSKISPLFLVALALLAWLVLPAEAQAQAIRNTATLTVDTDGGDRNIASNTVELTRGKFVTKITFHRLPEGWNPDYSMTRCELLARPTYRPIALDEQLYAAAAPLASLDIDNPYVMALDAPGENHDPRVREKTIVVASSSKRDLELELTETGPNTGTFAGMIPASGRHTGIPDSGCDLGYDGDSGFIRVYFEGDEDDSPSSNSLLIDPLGHVFDSTTGEAMNGITVTLIDMATGRPAAQVFGDDGVSAYPNSMVTGQNVTDAGGHVYHMGKGDFRFPLLPPGSYRLEVTPPAGYTAPSTASPDALKGFFNPDGEPYTIVPGSFGQPFLLSDPNPVTIDLPIDPMPITTAALTPRLTVSKVASVREAELGDVIQYRIEVRNSGNGAATPAVITDMMPQGLRYRMGSTRGAPEPETSNGHTLKFTLPNLAAGATAHIDYLVEVAPGARPGEAVNRAIGTAPMAPGAVPSQEASATVRIRAPLFTDAFTVIGRVTAGDCYSPERGRKGVAGIRLLMDDGSYVVTDADGLYHFEGVSPGTHVVQIDTDSVPGTHEPVACDADTRAGRSAISRFVEGSGGSLQRVDFQLRPTGKAAVAQDALPVTVAADATAAGNREDWLMLATPGVDWMFPDAEHNPRAPAVRAVIRHGADHRVALTLNGQPVDALSFDGTDADNARGVAVSRWSGLPLVEGDNRLEARVLDANGAVVATLTRVVHYANTAAHAEFVPAKSRLVADGLTKPLIAIRVADRDGRPVRAGTPVPFRVAQPHQAAQAASAQQARQLAGMERVQATAQVVGDEGLAFIELQPVRQSGSARIDVTLADREGQVVQDIKAWLSAPAQDWVVVGFGKGTIGYDILSGAERAERGRKGETVTDGQLSLYAKGRIKGSWLVTMAYDSDKDQERMRERGVLGAIDPDRYYTVYGDGTLQGHDAASRRKLYLRLERREFYALYGDFETGLVDTKLARYSRTMSGVKAEYTGNRVQFTAFAANDDNRFGRDEIQGNGLSGPYRLSARDIVPNSDKLRLETRDRFRSERVIETRELTRHIDYDIDPVAGTVRFREPILSRDVELNPVFIVADYETFGGSKKLVAGGRAAAKIGRAEIGASVIHDEGLGNATVAGVDLRAKLSATTEVRAEAATGGRQGLDSGQAWLAEIEHHGPRADVLAYARQQDRDFGLGQQNLGEAGTRKIGVDGRIKLSERWHLAGSAWHQQDLNDDVSRIAGDLRIERRLTSGTLYAGARFASDRTTDGNDRQSQLLTFGGTQNLLGNRLELNGEAQVPIGGKNDSIDFPARQRIGAAWRFAPWLRLIGGFEIAEGEKFTAQSTRLGFDVAPWAGSRVLATVNRGVAGENGTRTYAQYGLSQSLPLGKRWTIDATVDSSSTISGSLPQGDVVNAFQPASSGGMLGRDGLNEDFVATTLGATYRGDRWSWNGRAEYRSGTREERWGVTSNLLRNLGQGSTLASSLRAYRVREANGAVASSAVADLAFAFRPLDSRWSLLERFELRHESADGATSSRNALAVPVFASGTLATTRAVNNLALNYRTGSEGAGHGFEASFYYGAKYVRGRYAGERYDGFVDVAGVEIRKDLTTRFDLGAQASVQHSWNSGAANFSLGASAGASPGKNLWVTAGYNVTGYRDRDFEQARYTRQGPYVTLRMKFDQQSLGDLVRPILGGRR